MLRPLKPAHSKASADLIPAAWVVAASVDSKAWAEWVAAKVVAVKADSVVAKVAVASAASKAWVDVAKVAADSVVADSAAVASAVAKLVAVAEIAVVIV
jgi:hypothetical protein